MRPEAPAAARRCEIDALRGTAAIMVVAFHGASLTSGSAVWQPLGTLGGGLDLGVELFFVLSGYLVGGPFVRAVRDGRRPGPHRDFALRRAARIVPAYWLLLLATLALAGTSASQLPRVLLHAVLLQGVVPGETFQIVDLAWTLSVEALFYVAAPLAALAVLRRRPGGLGARRTVAAIAVVGGLSAVLAVIISSRWGDSSGGLLVTRGLPGCLALFAPGMLLACLEGSSAADRLRASRARRRCTIASGLAVVVAATCLAAGGILDYSARNAVAAAGFGLVVASAVLAPRSALPVGRAVRLAAAAGTVSYGIYLWHSLVATLLRGAGWQVAAGGHAELAWVLATAILLAPTLLLAAVSWRWVERPAIAAAASWIRMRRPAAPAGPAAPLTASAPSARLR